MTVIPRRGKPARDGNPFAERRSQQIALAKRSGIAWLHKGKVMPAEESERIDGAKVDQLVLDPRATGSTARIDVADDRDLSDEQRSRELIRRRTWQRLRLPSLVVLAVALAALVPTSGDFGLTWDEPAYRWSQVMSQQWWEQVAHARSWGDVQRLLDPTDLLYYWPYGRFGICFHPPLAGQMNLATYALFGQWLKDIPARRMASVVEFALTIAIGFHFFAHRYGTWVGAIMAGSLLLMPRLYGQAHLIDTDMPGLLLWAATALAFWNGLHAPGGRRWRVAVGVLLGLAFIEKMGAVMVLLPLLFWLILGYLPRALKSPGLRPAVIDTLLTTGAMSIPLGFAFQQILMLQRQLPPPKETDLFVHTPVSAVPGAILAIPLAIWLIRRLLARLFPFHKVWGVERPALETWTAILAFAPLVGWLGNPAWWRQTLPRLAHYYMLNTDRQGSLPKIQIFYLGQAYEYSLPWHNAWVLMATTVPVAILCAGAIGLVWGFGQVGRDRLPLYVLTHFLTLPVIRMLPTPAHDGVRLFLPAFFFLAVFAGWGTVWAADALVRAVRLPSRLGRTVVAGLVLGSSASALLLNHPYELSYYNELIGGPRRAWEKGFELTYWYDAFTDRVIDDLNRRFPPHATVEFLNEKTRTASPVFQERQNLGSLRGDIVLGRPDVRFPYVWLLTQDSKAAAFTRLLFAMRPWYASQPRQLDGARVLSVSDPVAVSRAWALFLLLDAADRSPDDSPAAPAWVRNHIPWLGRLWGDGPDKIPRPALNEPILAWSRTDPKGLLAAARHIAAGESIENDKPARRLYHLMTNQANHINRAVQLDLVSQLLTARPQGLVDAVKMLNAHRDGIVKIMTRLGYTDPSLVGGYLDRDLPHPDSPDGA
jgi:hypothetical protein